MAKLTVVMRRRFCASCGKSLLQAEPAELTNAGFEKRHEWARSDLLSRGWRELTNSLWLCGEHASGYQSATEDELRFLIERLLAHRTAYRFTLEFYIHNGRVVTETGARPATSQELEMWGILKRIEERQHPG